MTARLCSVRVGQPRRVWDPEPWVTAFCKDPVAGEILLSREHLSGDLQADPTVHGGPDKAVCVYSAEHYGAWRRELGVEDCGPGWFGENFTVENQSEVAVSIGDIYQIGGAVVEVSQPRGPCWKLAKRWGRPDLPKLVVRSGRSGWYLRVREEGYVSVGNGVTLMARPYPQWTIAIVNELTYARGRTARRLGSQRRELADCPALADSWRAGLQDGPT